MPIFGGLISTANGIALSGAVPTWVSTTGGAGSLSQLYQNQTPVTGLYQQQAMLAQTSASLVGANAVCVPSHQCCGCDATGGVIWVDNSQYYALAQGRVVICRERTAAERAAEEEAARLNRLRYEEQTRHRIVALTRSRELLVANLSAFQRKTFESHKWFVVEGGKTKQKYRIRTETYAGNIDVLNGSRVSHRLCVHCDGVPLHDHHLAQKLALEYDEERLLTIANRQAA
jgi:hypothetical protein